MTRRARAFYLLKNRIKTTWNTLDIRLLLDFLKSDSTALKHRHQDPHLVHILIIHFAKRWCYLISLWSPVQSTHGLGLFVLSAWGGPSPSWDAESFSTCWSYSMSQSFSTCCSFSKSQSLQPGFSTLPPASSAKGVDCLSAEISARADHGTGCYNVTLASYSNPFDTASELAEL